MGDKKLEALSFLLQPFILQILRELRSGPKRFGDLKKHVKNDRTLSLKLGRLQDNKLASVAHLKSERGYANFYVLTKKGRRTLEAVEKIG